MHSRHAPNIQHAACFVINAELRIAASFSPAHGLGWRQRGTRRLYRNDGLGDVGGKQEIGAVMASLLPLNLKYVYLHQGN